MTWIGVDAGGTFTDVVVVTDDRNTISAKALSTPGRPAEGVTSALRNAAGKLGVSLEALLEATTAIVHGTTVGLNALLSGTGARTGLITTAGFEDTVMIAKANKTLGLAPDLLTQATFWDKPRAPIARQQIVGVRERVDANGQVIVPLDDADAKASIQLLVDSDVEAIAVCLLWAQVNPAHERRIRELIRESFPDIDVSIASELAPLRGEYERTMTALLNAFVSPTVSRYLADLERELRTSGFDGQLLLSQSTGGVQKASLVARKAIQTLRSGPVGGVMASVAVAKLENQANIISTDVGGTSFDVGLVVNGEAQYARRPMVDRFLISLPLIDVESIGTGGGSLAWIDPVTGGLRVGPRSAGADPGPACYGRGGALPTLTDAATVLGYIERLGGALRLDVASARSAIDRNIATPLGLSVEAAADGILDVATAEMADLVRAVTVRRGYDPSEFHLYAFGAAAGQYVGRYGTSLGVREVVIPSFASVFSALGAVSSDLSTVLARDVPRSQRTLQHSIEWVSQSLREMESSVANDLGYSLGQSGAAVSIVRSAMLRFKLQSSSMAVVLPLSDLALDDVAPIVSQFHAQYERVIGRGAVTDDAAVEVVELRVEGRVRSPVGVGERGRSVDRTKRVERVSTRKAWMAGEFVDGPVYDERFLNTTASLAGPAFIELPDTTVVVQPGQEATVDGWGNIRLSGKAAT